MTTSVVAVLALAVAPPAWLGAQEASRAPAQVMGARPAWTIVWDHARDRVELRRPDGRVEDTWTRADAGGEYALLAVPPDRPLSVVVENANRLLYDYSVSAEVVRESETVQCRDFGSEFVRQGINLHLGAVAGGVSPGLPTIGEYLGGAFTAEDFRSLARSGGAVSLDRNDLRRTLEAVRVPVEEYVRFSRSVRRLADAVVDSMRYAAQAAESRSADSVLTALQVSIATEVPGLDRPEDVPAVLDARRRRVRPFAAPLVEAAQAVEGDSYLGSPTDPEAALVLELYADLGEALARADSSAITLQRHLLAIERARAGSRIVYSLSPAPHFRMVEIDLETSADPLFADLPRLRETVRVYTEPRVGLACRVSIGMAWMDHVPAYEEADGVLRRTPASSETRTTASLLLHLDHPGVPLLGALAGLGVGTEGGPDLYLGGSLRFFEPLMLNAGWVWQRGPELPGSLGIGSAVPDPALVEGLRNHYERFFFFGLSLAR